MVYCGFQPGVTYETKDVKIAQDLCFLAPVVRLLVVARDMESQPRPSVPW